MLSIRKGKASPPPTHPCIRSFIVLYETYIVRETLRKNYFLRQQDWELNYHVFEVLLF